ncbi:MAG: DEAD/DEAH box helicase family protein, partial [Pseudanabaena sp.]
MALFDIRTPWQPTADQPKAITQLLDGLQKGMRYQTLLGATGTGKTMTVANAIAKYQKPTLVLAHNKTLAAQLCNE